MDICFCNRFTKSLRCWLNHLCDFLRKRLSGTVTGCIIRFIIRPWASRFGHILKFWMVRGSDLEWIEKFWWSLCPSQIMYWTSTEWITTLLYLVVANTAYCSVYFFFFWFVLVEGIKMFFCLPENSLIRISFKLCGELLNSIKVLKLLNSYIMGKVCVCIYIYLKV